MIKTRRQLMREGAGLLAGGAMLGTPLLSCAEATSSSTGGQVMKTLHIPAEEDAHAFCFMQWPVSKKVYPDPVFLDMLQGSIAKVANAINDFEPVIITAAKEHHAAMKKQLAGNIEIWDIPTDDLWARDSGPVFAFDGNTPVVSGFNFNGWGNKQTHKNDGPMAKAVADRVGLTYMPSTLTGEAGGLEWDGKDTLLALESCWVNKNRNRGKSRDQITSELLAMYGAKNMIWSKGIKGEDITDYHIDSLARFVKPGQVIIQLPEDDGSDNPWVTEPFDAYDIIEAAGMDMQVLPTPSKPRIKSDDFVASYVNYYIANGAIIGAQFGDKETDAEANALLKKLYPGREVISLNIDPIGEVGGGIHCATQQCPKGIV